MMKYLFAVLLLSANAAWAAEDAVREALTTAVATEITKTESVTAKQSLDESQIPLNVDVSKKAIDNTSTSTRLLLTGLILVAIFGSTYYMVRKYKLSNTINKSNTKIKVLSQHYLGPKKSLAIIHVAGESILIGITDSNISMIKSLSLIDDEVPADLPQNFEDTLRLKTERPAGASAKSVQVEELEEEFSFAGVKDSVSKKIKSMRRSFKVEPAHLLFK